MQINTALASYNEKDTTSQIILKLVKLQNTKEKTGKAISAAQDKRHEEYLANNAVNPATEAEIQRLIDIENNSHRNIQAFPREGISSAIRLFDLFDFYARKPDEVERNNIVRDNTRMSYCLQKDAIESENKLNAQFARHLKAEHAAHPETKEDLDPARIIVRKLPF